MSEEVKTMAEAVKNAPIEVIPAMPQPQVGFRPLRADEVEVRIGTAKEGKGVSLLLYKDARCDMNVLDETVGPLNWQKTYSRENANCTVGIWDDYKHQWIWKEDTGTESNTEAAKGLASDSFKRACFNWGIGRELYTAPFIWIQGANKYDKFWVKSMVVENRKITQLTICCCDQYGNRKDDVAFEYPRKKKEDKKEEPKAKVSKEFSGDDFITAAHWKGLVAELKEHGIDAKWVLGQYELEKPSQMTFEVFGAIRADMKQLKADYDAAVQELQDAG